jgi:hypothetical protein
MDSSALEDTVGFQFRPMREVLALVQALPAATNACDYPPPLTTAAKSAAKSAAEEAAKGAHAEEAAEGFAAQGEVAGAHPASFSETLLLAAAAYVVYQVLKRAGVLSRLNA